MCNVQEEKEKGKVYDDKRETKTDDDQRARKG